MQNIALPAKNVNNSTEKLSKSQNKEAAVSNTLTPCCHHSSIVAKAQISKNAMNNKGKNVNKLHVNYSQQNVVDSPASLPTVLMEADSNGAHVEQIKIIAGKNGQHN